MKTSKYEGTWIPFDGDRLRFRSEVEKYLKGALLDPTGKLTVGNAGPEWNGKEKLAGLSYSNTVSAGEGWGVVVFSRTHALGVDLERENRVLKKNYLELAKRFFHASEYEALKKESIFDGAGKFLELWMKKEAYSKMRRKHLVEFINVAVEGEAVFEPLMKIRDGYRAIVALGSK